MENPKFKLPAYPLPFIHHLDIIEVAIQKGEDELLVDLANLVKKHINARLFEQNKAEFERLFAMLETSAGNRNPHLHDEVTQLIREIYLIISPPKTTMAVEQNQNAPLELKKILTEINLTERARKKD